MSLRGLIPCSLVLLLFAIPAGAERLQKKDCVIWVGLNGNRSQLVSSPLAIEQGDEIGIHAAFSYFLSDAWSAVVSGGIDAGRTELEVETPPGFSFKEASHSWNVRLGFDRYAFISDDVALYAGPGILYWTGYKEIPATAPFSSRLPDVNQWAFNGRVGMYARLRDHLGLFGHIGQVIGTNHMDSGGVKLNWWSNSPEGSVGLAMDF